MTVLALAAVAALGDNCTCLSPMAAPTGQEQPLQSRLPLMARRGHLPMAKATQSHLWVAQPDFTRQEKTLATSHPNVSPLLASLSLVFPYSSSCQRSSSACFFFSVLFVSMQTPYCCRHRCQGLRHPLGALPEQSNATIQAPPGWDCGSCSAPGRGGLQQAEGGQVPHSHPSLPPRETEDRNKNLGCLAG